MGGSTVITSYYARQVHYGNANQGMDDILPLQIIFIDF
jgi:hypothetical protein